VTAEESDDAVTKAIERRRRAIEAEWNELGAVVLIGAGDPIPIPGRADRVYPFLAHSEYFYLTDHQRPGAVLAYDPQEGWSEFVPAISADERLWSGALSDEAGTPASELAPWLERRRGRRVVQLGALIPNTPSDAAVTTELRTRMDRVRRRKDEIEVARMRLAADATCAGFAAAVPFIAAGISERRLQIEIEAGFFRRGADTVAYDSIIASGPNAAVLHHLPTQRLLSAGELVLIDAGAEYRGYDCDVTRTYPVSGDFSAEQADVYALVLRVQQAAIERCRAGVNTERSILLRPSTSPRDLLTPGSCAAMPPIWSNKAPPPCFFRTASDTWLAWVSATQVGICLGAHAPRHPLSGSCESTCRSNLGMSSPLSQGSTFLRTCSTIRRFAASTAIRSSGTASTRCVASAAFASRTTS
jgi:hypothetical protein